MNERGPLVFMSHRNGGMCPRPPNRNQKCNLNASKSNSTLHEGPGHPTDQTERVFFFSVSLLKINQASVLRSNQQWERTFQHGDELLSRMMSRTFSYPSPLSLLSVTAGANRDLPSFSDWISALGRLSKYSTVKIRANLNGCSPL